MSRIKIAAFLSTNMDGRSISDGFLASCSSQLSKMFHTGVEYITVELKVNRLMMRSGSTAPLMNVQLFHNSDFVDCDSKHQLAKTFAAWAARVVRVPEDRVLVLFLDTRYCNAV
ncbi:uncharacterized protein LOC106013771 [Aplysia californica]|uniref:Uncharacterized protein LOC106013771 n=1 Tax=Aplysia californica TaxID=6500 RepID=A0ABM1ADX4_APLCA|nr:uncharacterized protein LOC106013771 [Aplysia californica]